MRTALSIAGSDSSGGAGIQADLKTMTMNGVFAMSAITALTAQNTTGVSAILEVTPQFLQQQIDAVFEDIRPDAVKIGMVSSAGLIETIADRLTAYRAVNIVVDPVMVATSGARLLEADAVATLKEKLLPLAALATPNIPEAEILSHEIDEDSMEVFDEKTSIFNPFTVEDFTSFQSDQKAAMEEKALSRGLLAEARAKAVSSVEQLFAAALPDTYTVTVQ